MPIANGPEGARYNTAMESTPATDRENHATSQQDTTVDEQDSGAEVINEQTEALENDVSSDVDWNSLTWWQKPIRAARVAMWYTICLGLLLVGILLSSTSDKDKKESKRNQREQTRQMLLPGATSNTALSQSASTPDPSLSSSDRSTNDVTTSYLAVLHRSFGHVKWFIPHVIYALWGYAMVKVGSPPQQEQQLCDARRTAVGFQGNADMYGLGVRLGFYIQWLCLAFMFRFLPSARLYVVSGYLFYQVGMIVALVLLFSSSTCTFTAEVTIILQLLWAGSAIALVPTVSKRTKYPPKSDYLGIDLSSIVLAVLVFAFTSWFYIRAYFHGRYDFAPTYSDGSWFSLTGLMKPNDTKLFPPIPIIWILYAANELFGMLRDEPRDFLLSSVLEGNWWFSATMATGSLVLIIDWAFRGVRMLFAANQIILKGFGDEDGHKTKAEEDGRVVRINKWVTQSVMEITRVCWWPTRHLVIILWSILTVEYTLELNNIGGVRSLASTGQIIPLATSVATLLSLVYLWVKKFFDRGKDSGAEEKTPLVPDPEIAFPVAAGFPTRTGRWI